MGWDEYISETKAKYENKNVCTRIEFDMYDWYSCKTCTDNQHSFSEVYFCHDCYEPELHLVTHFVEVLIGRIMTSILLEKGIAAVVVVTRCYLRKDSRPRVNNMITRNILIPFLPFPCCCLVSYVIYRSSRQENGIRAIILVILLIGENEIVRDNFGKVGL